MFQNLIESLSRKKDSSYDECIDEDTSNSSGKLSNNASASDSGGGNNKSVTSDSSGQREKLSRVLGLADLTLLGIGSTLGLGVYILGGAVAKNQAGPAVILSLVLAAVASAFSGKLSIFSCL
uniref:High affinity cationic amino acid transporter 1 n=1 Tax=Cacopsylla melanoneura TaxID=428564 RepID=A0A8D9E3X9_9HEMI